MWQQLQCHLTLLLLVYSGDVYLWHDCRQHWGYKRLSGPRPVVLWSILYFSRDRLWRNTTKYVQLCRTMLSCAADPSYYGQSCTSAANDCGQTQGGTYNCSDVCSAGAPADPSYYGQSCSISNVCGTNYGTYDCNDNCNATNPEASNYGQTCQSSRANICGDRGTGTIQCNGTCNAVAPPNPKGQCN